MSIIYASYIDKLDPVKRKKHIYYSNKGVSHVPEYGYEIVDGIKQLVKIGEKDLDSYIQSFKAEADINVILSRFLNGDSSVINQSVGSFGDFRDCPTTYAEMFQRVHDCEKFFDSLPVDVKEKFDNSYTKFWSEFGSDYFNNVFESFNTASDAISVPESEVVDNAE